MKETSSPATDDRPGDALQERVTQLLGERPQAWRLVEGGYTPAKRWRVRTASGSCFVKVATNNATARMLRGELLSYEKLSGDFMPTFIAGEDHPTAPILAIEDLSHAAWPPPWTPEGIERVLAAIEALHQSKATLPPFDGLHGDCDAQWQSVADAPEPFLGLGIASARWLEAALPALIEAEASCSLAGDAVCHFDIRSDNLCWTERGAVLVDWSGTCLSNPTLDLGFWLPSLAYERGGVLPETILPHEPEVAAWVSGFMACRAGLPTIPSAPRVRLVQCAQLSTALPWAMRALSLPPLDGARPVEALLRADLC